MLGFFRSVTFVLVISSQLNHLLNQSLVEKITTISYNFFQKTYWRRVLSTYLLIIKSCLIMKQFLYYRQFSNIKTWQWCLKRNKPTRLNKLLWNEPDIFKILYRIGKKVQNINWTLSLISNKNFLFSWAKILKLSKQGK